MKFLHALLIFSLPFYAQTNFPQDYFQSPLSLPLQLAGNFGELRPNHFHAGFDFRTQQKEGFPILAAAEGYISRIKISPFGYGKAIYVTHPNGYTTVYGHLQKGYGAIEDFIKREQYRQQSFEIEVMPKENELLIQRGDTIAISGNTGGSEGPHLHFEIRDTKTERTLNPLFFGFDKKIPDTRKPQLSALMVYPIDSSSVANQSKRPVALNLALQKDGNYIAEKVLACGRVGFGIVCSDLDDVSYNNNGIYKVEVFSNGSPCFSYQFDSLAFDEGRYVNALIDFPRYKSTRQRVQKLFMKTPYNLSNVNPGAEQGIVSVLPNFSQFYKVVISDFNNNKVSILVPVEYMKQKVQVDSDQVVTPYYLKATIDNIYQKDGMEVSFPAHTFYDDFYLNFEVKGKVMSVHDDRVPVHSNFRVAITDSTAVSKDKTFIASVEGGKLKYNSTKFANQTFTAFTRNLGKFTLALDTIAPKITPLKPLKDKELKEKRLTFKISDDLSGIKTYNGFLNGQWILFEYDAKTNRIFWDVEDKFLLEGKNELKLVVSDNLGNSAIFEASFLKNKTTLNKTD